MPYDAATLFERIMEQVRRRGSITTRMRAVIDECARQRPGDAWAEFRGIEFEADLPRIERWLADACHECEASDHQRGLWLGIHQPVRERTTTDMYLAGAPCYDPEDIDWASRADFFPESRQLESPVLDAIYRLSYDPPDGLGNDAEYPLALAYAAMIARKALTGRKMEGPFETLEGVAVGYDSGDGFYLGRFRHGKFVFDLRPY